MLRKWDDLYKHLVSNFCLDFGSLHGPSHWESVAKIGQKVGSLNKIDLEVVELFAMFHDSCRRHEFEDKNHGLRAANLAKNLRGELYEISDENFEKLYIACSEHEMGNLSNDLIIGTCWDADRLDLVRVGIKPDKRYMSTIGGKLFIKNI